MNSKDFDELMKQYGYKKIVDEDNETKVNYLKINISRYTTIHINKLAEKLKKKYLDEQQWHYNKVYKKTSATLQGDSETETA